MVKFIPNSPYGQLTVQPMPKVTKQVDIPSNLSDAVAGQVMDAANDIINRALGSINQNYISAKQRHDLSDLDHQRYTRKFVGGEMDILFSYNSEKVALRLKPELSSKPPEPNEPTQLSPELPKTKLSYPLFWPQEGWYFGSEAYPSKISTPYQIKSQKRYSLYNPEYNLEGTYWRGGVQSNGVKFLSSFQVAFDNTQPDQVIATRVFTPGKYTLTQFSSTDIKWGGYNNLGQPIVDPAVGDMVSANFSVGPAAFVPQEQIDAYTGYVYDKIYGGQIALAKNQVSSTPLYFPPLRRADLYQGQTAAAIVQTFAGEFLVPAINLDEKQMTYFHLFGRGGTVSFYKHGYFPEHYSPFIPTNFYFGYTPEDWETNGFIDVDLDGTTEMLKKGDWVQSPQGCTGQIAITGELYPMGYVNFDIG